MKNRIIKTITINKEISFVYNTLKEIEKWYLWTTSINKISFLTDRGFEVGAKIKIEQPKLPSAIWTITEIDENKMFTWKTRRLGTEIIGKHWLEELKNDTIVTLEIEYNGFWESIFHKLSSKITTQYLELEINGLKAICEKQRSE